MVQSDAVQLKADALKLSKILATNKVKLSPQQCLDVLSRLRWNLPYEALSANHPADLGRPPEPRDRENDPLHGWLACGWVFCELVETLDRHQVADAVYGHVLPHGLLEDGMRFLMAIGVATERFSRIAQTLVGSCPTTLCKTLSFAVAAGAPIPDGTLAVLRIQSVASDTGKPTGSRRFDPVEQRLQCAEPLLYGAEARVTLRTVPTDLENNGGPYRLRPLVELAYEVAGQQALEAFGVVLKKFAIPAAWKAVGDFDVETELSLTQEDRQEPTNVTWRTADDPNGERLLRFCQQASQLSDEDTPDWPPYLRLSRTFEAHDTQDDLERYFLGVCAHAECLWGPSGAWNEAFALWRNERPSS